MRAGDRLPGDQAEVTFSTEAVEWIAENIDQSQWDDVLDDIVALFTKPWSKHPLSNRTAADRLAGLNTTATLRGDYRIIFRAGISASGTGSIEIVALGPRSDNRIYDAVNALLASGKLNDDEVQSVWDMLTLFERTAEKHGLELWDYRPAPAPPGLVKSVVAIGALPQEIAELLSTDELNAAAANAWDPETGELDPVRALRAATDRVAGSSDPGGSSFCAKNRAATPRCPARQRHASAAAATRAPIAPHRERIAAVTVAVHPRSRNQRQRDVEQGHQPGSSGEIRTRVP